MGLGDETANINYELRIMNEKLRMKLREFLKINFLNSLRSLFLNSALIIILVVVFGKSTVKRTGYRRFYYGKSLYLVKSYT